MRLPMAYPCGLRTPRNIHHIASTIAQTSIRRDRAIGDTIAGVRPPTPDEVAAARRVLRYIRKRAIVAQQDALLLRLWAEPRSPQRPLAEIAARIIETQNEPPTGSGPPAWGA